MISGKTAPGPSKNGMRREKQHTHRSGSSVVCSQCIVTMRKPHLFHRVEHLESSFKLLRVYPPNCQKSRKIRIQFFAANYKSRHHNIQSACNPYFRGSGLTNADLTFRHLHFEVLFVLLTASVIVTTSTGMFNNRETGIGCETFFMEI